jgi:sugar/nucleoside kinase (ribokinase family)
MKAETMPLVALGTIAYDDIETPFGSVRGALGGSAVYFSLAASFYARCGVVGVVGADFPAENLGFLEERGVDLSGIEVCGGRTFHWSGSYGHDMNAAKTLQTDLNVLATFRPKVPKAYRGCGFLFLANIDPSLQLEVLDEVKPKHCLCDTMNYWITSKKRELTEVFERVDGIIINDGEARQFCGTPNLIKAGRMLTEYGGGRVIVKKGEHGAIFFSGDGFFAAPGFPTADVVDPTGAGDSFAGGLMGRLARRGLINDEEVRKSMVCGSVMASYVVEGFSLDGIRGRTLADIERRYDTFRRMVAFDHGF